MLYRFFHTLRYLRPVQIYGRIWFRLFHPKPDLSPSPHLSPEVTRWQKGILKKAALIVPWTFCFLNKVHQCRFPDDWNSKSLDKLWLYNLHYFNDLVGPLSEKRRKWYLELIERWIDDNPPGFGNGWEPYTLSLRIVNWIKWQLLGNELTERATHSLSVQTRYLAKRLEYHLLGNHLWANAKALLFAGLFFQGREADKWLDTGFKILHKEIGEQILQDGGHFELSPMYHAIVLEDLLDIINLFQVYDQKVHKEWIFTSKKMFAWLISMCHPDGDIALFNDSTLGGASLSSFQNYFQGLKIKAPSKNLAMNHMKESGYIRCRKGPAMILMDVGKIGPDYLPAHAHADTLNFELSLENNRFIVDSGVSCYKNCPERMSQRSTSAHNTVVVNGKNSSVVWGGFRVAKRANPIDLSIKESSGNITIRCGHDGYKRLAGNPVHYRTWKIDETSLSICDSIQGNYKSAVSYYHFHPEVQVTLNKRGSGGIAEINKTIHVEFCFTGCSAIIAPSTYSPEFGLNIQNTSLQLIFLEPESEVTFFWKNGEA